VLRKHTKKRDKNQKAPKNKNDKKKKKHRKTPHHPRPQPTPLDAKRGKNRDKVNYNAGGRDGAGTSAVQITELTGDRYQTRRKNNNNLMGKRGSLSSLTKELLGQN